MIPILIDGQLLPYGRPLLLRQAALLAPIRGVLDRLADRVYEDRAGNVVVSRGLHHLILYRGTSQAFVDGNWRHFPLPLQYRGATVYVPLRATLEALGYTVSCVQNPKVIELTSPAGLPLASLTPPPNWYPVIIPHVVLTPTPLPRVLSTRPPFPERRRTPIPVGPYYRTF